MFTDIEAYNFWMLIVLAGYLWWVLGYYLFLRHARRTGVVTLRLIPWIMLFAFTGVVGWSVNWFFENRDAVVYDQFEDEDD